jgi:hypothetical protein
MLLTKYNENFEEIEFLHQERKSNQDVERACATDSIMNFLLLKLFRKFQILRHLKFNNVIEQISKNLLLNCAQLETIDMRTNKNF